MHENWSNNYNNDITYEVRDNFPFSLHPVPYRVQIDEGVAKPAGGGCLSEPEEWDVMLKGNKWGVKKMKDALIVDLM